MANLHRTQENITAAYCDSLLDDVEFLMLYDANKSRNVEYKYWEYQAFDLDTYNDEECKAYFR